MMRRLGHLHPALARADGHHRAYAHGIRQGWPTGEIRAGSVDNIGLFVVSVEVSLQLICPSLVPTEAHLFFRPAVQLVTTLRGRELVSGFALAMKRWPSQPVPFKNDVAPVANPARWSVQEAGGE